jgi:hypothetical protein|tara:strand:- start:2392 stop:3840 length:1449 start_codon:yes stop_codon:yes gene_type:complete
MHTATFALILMFLIAPFGQNDRVGRQLDDDETANAGALIRASKLTPAKHRLSEDTVTLQRALDAAAGQVLVIPPGHYTLTAQLRVPQGTTVFANEATLDFSRFSGKAITNEGSDFTWRGGRIIGSGGDVYNGRDHGFAIEGSRGPNGATPPKYAHNILIDGVEVRGFGYAGIWLSNVRNVELSNNKLIGLGYAGILGTSVVNASIERNLVDRVKGKGAPDTYGIAIDRLEDTLVRDPPSRNVRIRYNTITNIPNWEAIDTHGGIDFDISHNQISKTRFGIAIVGSDIGSKVALGAKNVRVANNIIEGSSGGAAIVVAGAMTGAVVNDYASDIQILDNQIFGGGAADDASEGSIRVYGTNRVHIRRNVIRGPYAIGINIISDNQALEVSGNTIIDVRNPTDAVFPRMIGISGSNNTGKIFDNTFELRNRFAAKHVATFSIVTVSGLTGLDLTFGPHAFVGRRGSLLATRFETTRGVILAQLRE